MSAIEFTEEQIITAHDAPPLLNQLELSVEAERIARRHDTTLTEMRSRARHPHIVAARAEVYKLLRSRGWSYPAIAKAWGRDHTTVMAAVGATHREKAR